jgi:hypothetical protein
VPPAVAVRSIAAQPAQPSAELLVPSPTSVATVGSSSSSLVAAPRLPSDPRQQYAGLPANVLVDLLVSRDASIRSYREELRLAKRQKKTAESAVAIAGQSDTRGDDPNAPFMVERHGRHQGWLTKRSGIAIALRRNMTNVAAKDIGSCMLEDISHQTVVRYELLAASSLIACARLFHKHLDHELELRRLDNDADICVASFSWSCDATNSSVWQQSKLHNLRLTSAYQLSHGGCTAADTFFHRSEFCTAGFGLF